MSRSVCTALVLMLHLSVLSQTVDPFDETLVSYELTPAMTAQFSRTDGQLSPFWALWTAHDTILEVAPDNCYPDRCNFVGTDDAQLSVKSAWDSTGLYVCLTAWDNTWVDQSSTGDWGADASDMYVDKLSANEIFTCTDCLIGLYSSTLTYTTNMFFIGYGATSPPDGFSYQHYDENLWSWQEVGLTFQAADVLYGVKAEVVTLDGTHKATEWFYPWDFLDVNNEFAGDRFGFTVGYNDKDGDNTNPDCLRWLGKDPWAGDAQTVNYWGDILLGPDVATLGNGIYLASPNGGSCTVGDSVPITWVSGGLDGLVKIDLSTDNGGTWTSVSSSTDDDGVYRWLVPDSVSDSCLIRISDAADGDPADTSDPMFSIVPPSVTVTWPNGPETLVADTTVAITWTSSGVVGDVKIDFTDDGGTTWLPVSAATANDGAFSWDVPDSVSSQCRIRLSEAADGEPWDESDTSFSIVPHTIALQSPNGGEDFVVDSMVYIRWSSRGGFSSVGIQRSLDSGATWDELIGSTFNDGSHAWRPDSVSAACLVRIWDAADSVPCDTSDAVFGIAGPTLRVVQPSGGDTWQSGMVKNITWAHRGTVSSVAIDYSLDAGATWQSVVSSTTNDGQYGWQVPDTTVDDCLVRIMASGDTSPADTSDSCFSIIEPTLEILTPNGGEQWKPGTFHNVTWTTVAEVPRISLEYSTNGGTRWSTIVANFPNVGSYNWTIPNVYSDICLVRVSDATDRNPQDGSDSAFSIGVSVATHAQAIPARTEIPRLWAQGGAITAQVALAEPARVTVRVHTLDGRTVVGGDGMAMDAGHHRVSVLAETHAAGTTAYVVEVRAGHVVRREVVRLVR